MRHELYKNDLSMYVQAFQFSPTLCYVNNAGLLTFDQNGIDGAALYLNVLIVVTLSCT